ncbi:ISLre2 family transposase [Caloramator sp. CAR-1]|uniref:ISLre2 family transposase n=1 Tax=Caloramator sp. CAR-1 TaxID=3062777 RepID=UPI0026E2ADCB|nr:ISLre2 family transposase [Caloramator sp. CAR-1]MDO6355945.1 ISLre2 family transposase [Caloramator sp. CAR-1]
MSLLNNIIQQHLINFTTKLIKNVEETISKEWDLTKLVDVVKKMTDELGANIIKDFLEELDKTIKEDEKRKKGWVVERKDKKKIVTMLGEIEYARTYYKSKKNGEYRYLLDEIIGISKHEKVDKEVKIKLVENAINMSYEESSKITCPEKLSRQTVFNAIRQVGEVEVKREVKEKRKVRVLYIEADEDHVALQDGKKEMPRLVYIHEGRQSKNGRNELKNVYYKAYVGVEAEEIWIDVANYVYDNYEIESIEKIYIAGDGARWIKEGMEWIPKAKFVLDRYHLNKYIIRGTAKREEYRQKIWGAINEGDKKVLREIFKELINIAETKTEKERAKEARKYILNNWEGIVIYKGDEDVIGCSAEGHISHVLSVRLSSRPLGWSKEGLKIMAKLRVFSRNGGNLREISIYKEDIETFRLNKKKIKETIKRINNSSREGINNITILNIGKVTPMYKILKSIKYENII